MVQSDYSVSSLSEKERKERELDNYKDYKSALKDLYLESLAERGEKLCLRFAKKCLKLQKFKILFPENKKLHCMNKRKRRKFYENKANTERYKRSSIP